MRKAALLAVLIFIGAVFSVSYGRDVKAAANTNKASEIKFEYFFRGFITLKDSEVQTYPKDSLVISTDADWHDFMDKYVPGIPYYISVNYSKECLVFNQVLPAKPFYSIGADIKGFTVNGKMLEPVYAEKPVLGISNGIYARNINGIMHSFVNIVKINKKDLPKGITNIYHKSGAKRVKVD